MIDDEPLTPCPAGVRDTEGMAKLSKHDNRGFHCEDDEVGRD
jgi:hypothetical protein